MCLKEETGEEPLNIQDKAIIEIKVQELQVQDLLQPIDRLLTIYPLMLYGVD